MIRATLLTTSLLGAVALPAAAAQPTAAGAGAPAGLCPPGPGWSALPLAGYRAAFRDGRWRGRVSNMVSVAPDGGYRWNGAPIDADTLGRYLAITVMMAPRPALVLNREAGADCARIAEAAALVGAHLDCTPDLCILTAGEIPRTIAPPAPPPPGPPK